MKFETSKISLGQLLIQSSLLNQKYTFMDLDNIAEIDQLICRKEESKDLKFGIWNFTPSFPIASSVFAFFTPYFYCQRILLLCLT